MRLWLVVLIVGQAADALTTFVALRRGAVERNPFLGQRPRAILAIKAIAAIVTATVFLVLEDRVPWWAPWIGGGVMGIVGAIAAVHNLGVIRKGNRR